MHRQPLRISEQEEEFHSSSLPSSFSCCFSGFRISNKEIHIGSQAKKRPLSLQLPLPIFLSTINKWEQYPQPVSPLPSWLTKSSGVWGKKIEAIIPSTQWPPNLKSTILELGFQTAPRGKKFELTNGKLVPSQEIPAFLKRRKKKLLGWHRPALPSKSPHQ